MHRRVSAWLVVVLVWALGTAASLAGQGVEVAARGPRFLSAASPTPVPLDVSTVAVLRQRVSLDLTDARLEEALTEITRQSGLRFMYSMNVLPTESRVQLQAKRITVAAALTELLVDAGVDVVLTRNGQALLVRRGENGVKGPEGIVAGRITDAKTGEAVLGAEVWVEGTRHRAYTGENGYYRLTGVPVGSHTLAIRRVGYAKQTRPVAVGEGEASYIDVALPPMPTQLDEVITTVTGEQRLLELGHVVGRINADSLVKAAPISSMTELLTARIPGLQVFQKQGTVGGEVRLQIRSPNSLTLGTEPIVIVDGVRFTSGSLAAAEGSSSAGFEAGNRLNDLNPNDVESIEVVKGPSAASLYGTDAANGVIVVTTKRGRPGPARWNAYVRTAMSEVPKVRHPDVYWGWSESVFGSPDLSSQFSCTLYYISEGFCTQDSVTAVPNPLNRSDLTIFADKPSWISGLSVSGGRTGLTYRFSADAEQAGGAIQMPKALADSLRRARGVADLPEEQLTPNAFNRFNLSGNVGATLGRWLDVGLNVGYIRRSTRSLSLNSPYGRGASGNRDQPYTMSPALAFSRMSTERADRFLVSANAQGQAAPWLLVRGSVGLDLGNTLGVSITPPNSEIVGQAGSTGDDRARQVGTSADLGATVTLERGRLSSRTSVGAQYTRSLSDGLYTTGTTILGEAVPTFTRSVTRAYSELVTLGSYVEETVGWNHRLYLTGAVRVDGASAFGRDYDAAAYPRASASWLLSEEPFVPRLPGLDELRLRYAFGVAGQQARPDMTLPLFTATGPLVDGTTRPGVSIDGLGNADLRPERVREHEFGADLTGLGGRVYLNLTWFRRRTTDQIVSTLLPPGLGSIYTNLGLTRAKGFEAQLTVRVLDTRALSWDVSVNHAFQTTTLIDIGTSVPRYSRNGGYVEGYPIGARFMTEIVGYADANGDGIISPSEVQIGDTAVFVGHSLPPRSQTLSTTLGLFRRSLRLSALFERRSGFTQVDALRLQRCFLGRCRESVDRTTPLADQVEIAAINQGAPNSRGDVFYAPLGSGTFTRLREVTAAFDLPPAMLQALRLSSATLSLSARNLALWTAFGGPDPESASITGIQGGVADGIPQARSWTLRMDVGL